MTKTTPRQQLSAWFTGREMQVYFGARSESELGEIARQMARMTPDERARFKRVLAGTGRDATAHRRRN